MRQIAEGQPMKDHPIRTWAIATAVLGGVSLGKDVHRASSRPWGDKSGGESLRNVGRIGLAMAALVAARRWLLNSPQV